MTDAEFKRSILEYNAYEDQRDDRYMLICRHIKANVRWNRHLTSYAVNRTYSLAPLADDTTYLPERWWINGAFHSYLDFAHSAYLQHASEIYATHYLFSELMRNILPLYRIHYGIWGACVYQYLDLRNELWQSLPF